MAIIRIKSVMAARIMFGYHEKKLESQKGRPTYTFAKEHRKFMIILLK